MSTAVVNGEIDEELSNGNSESFDDDGERYAPVNFSNSGDVDFEQFTKIAIKERDDCVDDELSESPKMEVTGENTTRDLNIDGDVERMIRPHGPHWLIRCCRSPRSLKMRGSAGEEGYTADRDLHLAVRPTRSRTRVEIDGSSLHGPMTRPKA
ncbi:hypothetical protein RHSIM_Rhsim05G0121200 [Rhododendron simsii]|uniref:Uncharacterized protein n=1 Tax=Rhododendron simsii TaxID=118357 RepID=A0A834LNZ3_RHOSS|nr:hypothetical protein RHSIM_Rhsim05G0121200 [Rhododendron simsii]